MGAFQRAYVVCSTQRSGSTYLCQLLSRTGTLGKPQEFFEARAETGLPPHPGYFLAGLPRTGAGIRDDVRPTTGPEYSNLTTVDGWEAHLERTFALGTTPNGVFGAKLMWNQLADIEQHAGAIERFTGLRGLALLSELFAADARPGTSGCGDATRYARRSVCGERYRRAPGASSTPPATPVRRSSGTATTESSIFVAG